MDQGSGVIFNDGGLDHDFRVESNSNAYGFYLQAAHASNSSGTIGFASSNSDGNRIESTNDQNGVWHMYLNNTHTGANPYGLKIRHGVANDDQNGWFIQCLDTSSVRFGVYNDGGIDLADSKALRLGTGNDLTISFDGTNSVMDHTPGSGGFYIRGV